MVWDGGCQRRASENGEVMKINSPPLQGSGENKWTPKQAGGLWECSLSSYTCLRRVVSAARAALIRRSASACAVGALPAVLLKRAHGRCSVWHIPTPFTCSYFCPLDMCNNREAGRGWRMEDGEFSPAFGSIIPQCFWHVKAEGIRIWKALVGFNNNIWISIWKLYLIELLVRKACCNHVQCFRSLGTPRPDYFQTCWITKSLKQSQRSQKETAEQ